MSGRKIRSVLPGTMGTLHLMAMVVQLPDHVAAAATERAAERGVTVAEFICELVERADRRQALEAFIGGADEPVREPFDIHSAREQLSAELLTEHQAISEDFARGRAHSSEGSRGLG
jgi:hypothetical protein